MKNHNYQLTLTWTGNTGKGTQTYRSYERSHQFQIPGKPTIDGSSDPSFRGDPTKHNPEELFLAAIASCHMLWYLHFCSDAGINVIDYQDIATGIMQEESNGSGQFTSVTLHPTITITNPNQIELAKQLHHKANEFCFIANSCNFPIEHQPIIQVKTL